MSHYVTEACIKCKYTDCVEVCPVDCFHEGPNFLVINPDECIDCGVCIPECPVEAIVDDNTLVDRSWEDVNRRLAAKWPVITKRKPELESAEEFKHVKEKRHLLEE